MVLIIKVQRTTLNVNKHIFHINMYVYTFLNYACQIFEGVRFKMYIILKLMSNKSIFFITRKFCGHFRRPSHLSSPAEADVTFQFIYSCHTLIPVHKYTFLSRLRNNQVNSVTWKRINPPPERNIKHKICKFFSARLT